MLVRALSIPNDDGVNVMTEGIVNDKTSVGYTGIINEIDKV
jgi:hypothetical protein